MNDADAVALRHALHRHPEMSGHEGESAERVGAFLEATSPDDLVRGLGGHGVAAIFEGEADGPTVMLRAELDALPIHETGDREYRSGTAGVSHACGHDGHAAALAAAALRFRRVHPAIGRVVLLFQPAEETGRGAKAVLDDPAFERLRPDLAFALHNLPGARLRDVVVREGPMASGSVAAAVHLRGESAQAAYPENATSPAGAVAALIERFSSLGATATPDDASALSTVTHARIGERALGTTPGEAEIVVTVRAGNAASLDALRRAVRDAAEQAARDFVLEYTIDWEEEFPATVNSADAVEVVRRAARSIGLPTVELPGPFRWSEDFGWFASRAPSALVGLGAGEDHVPLHHTSYDFPDELVVTGADLLLAIAQEVLGPYAQLEPVPHY